MAVYPISEKTKEEYGTFQQAIANALSRLWQGSEMTQKPFGEFAAGMMGYPQDYNQAVIGGLQSSIFPALIKADIQRPDLIEKAKNIFGTTKMPKESGYILPNGEMLDFSGRIWGEKGGKRFMDHTEIWPVMEGIPSGPSHYTPDDFMNLTNSVRMSLYNYNEPMLLQFVRPPSKNIINTIAEMLPYSNKEVFMDIVNPSEAFKVQKSIQMQNASKGKILKWLEDYYGK